jgi:hypothetical protein
MRMDRPFLAQESGCRLERWKKMRYFGLVDVSSEV